MEAKIGVFNTHEDALKEVELLTDNGINPKSISLVGKADVVDDHIHVQSLESVKNAPALLGVGAGTVVGMLVGMGVFAVPGFGFLYGAGAVIGAIAGFDIGIVGGGLATILASIGIKKDHLVRYEEHVKEGKFLVIVHGNAEEIAKAKALA